MAVVLAGAEAARLRLAEHLVELLRRVALVVDQAHRSAALVRQPDDLRQAGADGVVPVNDLLGFAYFRLI